MRRFESRANDPLRQWKLTDEDWRNRERWDIYSQAVDEMLLKTSTVTAPWTIVEGDDKHYARVKVLETLVDKLSVELDFDPFSEGAIKSTAKSKDKKKKDKNKN